MNECDQETEQRSGYGDMQVVQYARSPLSFTMCTDRHTQRVGAGATGQEQVSERMSEWFRT